LQKLVEGLSVFEQKGDNSVVVTGDKNIPVSLNQLTLCCKGSGVSKRFFFWGFWGESIITLLSANLKRLEVGLTSSNH
jgi:hypothetical protein